MITVTVIFSSGYSQKKFSGSHLSHLLSQVAFGKEDSAKVVKQVMEKGDTVVPALQEILIIGKIALNKPWMMGMQTDSGGEVLYDKRDKLIQKNAVYAVAILDAIGSERSYNALIDETPGQSDPEIRGHSLNALAGSYYKNTRSKKFVPNRKVIPLLLTQVNDSLYVKATKKSIAQAAREGVNNWLGDEIGIRFQAKPGKKLQNDSLYLRYIKQYEKLEWDDGAGKFTLKE
jgi:hypothetical protein